MIGSKRKLTQLHFKQSEMDTMTKEIKDQHIARFKALFDQHEQKLNGQRLHPAHQIRKEAADQLESLRFPTRRDEDYKYTSFTKVFNQDYQLPTTAKTVNSADLADLLLEDEQAGPGGQAGPGVLPERVDLLSGPRTHARPALRALYPGGP